MLSQQNPGRTSGLWKDAFLAGVKGCMVQKGTSALNESSRRRRRRLPTAPQFTSLLMLYGAFLQGVLLGMNHYISNLKIFGTCGLEAER